MSDVKLERTGSIARVIVDGPNSRNAIARRTVAQLADVVGQLEESRVSVIVITGAGDKSFISGGDLKDLQAVRSTADARLMSDSMRSVLDRVASLRALTIAAINGSAFGGGAEVALSCDLRIMGDRSTVSFNQSQLAIMPAWGGAERLVELVGRASAIRLMTSGERVDADSALSMGLIDYCVGQDTFWDEAEHIAEQFARCERSVISAIKATVNRVQPPCRPDLALDSVESFARLWVAPEHWTAVERLQTRESK